MGDRKRHGAKFDAKCFYLFAGSSRFHRFASVVIIVAIIESVSSCIEPESKLSQSSDCSSSKEQLKILWVQTDLCYSESGLYLQNIVR